MMIKYQEKARYIHVVVDAVGTLPASPWPTLEAVFLCSDDFLLLSDGSMIGPCGTKLSVPGASGKQ